MTTIKKEEIKKLPSTTTTTTNTNTTTENRSKYKTFILSAAVFEVEQRFEIREIIGQGAYGIVW
jgi:hypothetical protein